MWVFWLIFVLMMATAVINTAFRMASSQRTLRENAASQGESYTIR